MVAGEVASAMNAGGTQDIRAIDTVPLLRKLLKGSEAPTPRAQQMLDLMVSWRNAGGSRLDLDLDGEIDDPGAAVMDGSWSNIADAFMKPRLGTQLDELATLFSRFDLPPERPVLGLVPVLRPRHQVAAGDQAARAAARTAYCGKGKLKACQNSIWAAIEASGAEIAAEQGTEDPAAWRSDATARADQFSPLPLKTMRYTNRPSGIQQVISFKGHRPEEEVGAGSR